MSVYATQLIVIALIQATRCFFSSCNVCQFVCEPDGLPLSSAQAAAQHRQPR